MRRGTDNAACVIRLEEDEVKRVERFGAGLLTPPKRPTEGLLPGVSTRMTEIFLLFLFVFAFL